jgi:hypothetical protein
MTMMLLVAGLLTALMMSGTSLLSRYVQNLPEAPACPSCQRVTRQAIASRIVYLLPMLEMTALRECHRCGWRGRMRWRFASDPVRYRG